MNEDDMTLFQIIAAAGTARSKYLEAVASSKSGALADADRLVAEGDTSFLEGHELHASLLQRAASQEGLEITLMHVHAEDQLMSAEEFKIIALELIDLYRRLPAMRTQV